MNIDDATLMAFADGELPEPRAAEVGAAVAADPALAARVERFRVVRGRLAGALDDLAPPADILARAAQAEAGRAAAGPRAWLPAMAAGVAGLVVGAAAISALQPAGPLGPGQTARGVLRAALDDAPSGTARRGVEPLYSVVAADGRACRAFRSAEGARGYEGVACREGATWRVLALAEASPRASGYGQASGDEPAAIAAALDDLRPGPPLSSDEETARIRAGWRE